MTFIDLTHTIDNNILEFPEDPKTTLKQLESEDCILFEYSTSLHTGTHMDSPYHYFFDKKIKDIPLDQFIGPCTIVNSNNKEINSTEPLEEIVIINTGKSKDWNTSKYFIDFPSLPIEFCERLVEENVKGVAIDTCSVDKIGETQIHKFLLKNNIWIVENINTNVKIENRKCMGYFIPLKIDAEASQVRAFIKV